MKNFTATYVTGRNEQFVAETSFDALNVTVALAQALNNAPANSYLLEVNPTASLSEELNLCPHCYAAAGEPTIVDVPDNPFAICQRCDEEDNELDLEIVAVKRADVI